MIEYELLGTCRMLSDVPEGARITSVNGREVYGMCEVCGKPVYCDSRFFSDADGVIWHKRHGDVTKEGKQ